MSQAELLPPTQVSLPPITYKGVPVVTTEMLAVAYECDPKQIRQNFANNKERFVAGKHFYTLANGELTEFRLCVENFDSQISLPAKARKLTLWLERGAARHAKMLNTDRAWDVFEMLEETFFRVVRPEQPALESAARPKPNRSRPRSSLPPPPPVFTAPALTLADIDRLHMEMRGHMQDAVACASKISKDMDERSKRMKYTAKHNVMCYLEFSFNSFADAWEAIAEAMKNNAKAMVHLQNM
jgi:hypothetical protein